MDAFEPLLGGLKDEDPEVRSRDAFYLGAAAAWAPEFMDKLTAALTDQDPGIRCGGIYALEHAYWFFGGSDRTEAPRKATIASFTGALADAEVEVRRTAAFVLGQLHYSEGRQLAPAAVPALEKALKGDEDPTVRYRAALALMRIREEDKDKYEQEASKAGGSHGSRTIGISSAFSFH